MPQNRLPQITPPEPQENARPAPRVKVKARAFPWQSSMPIVEMMVIIGVGMMLLLA